ncbi:hypothetical protein L198_00718 [Cryptococcus wingfieldii CBS 7118]|uniref:Uncharacterized protein n=1 Tax=Cryptococcus wingfieldii CBS 7118 TaxID=1295528 RepID=A0A1E3K299_9TREE|nr:hypothetical protein L198_00718 [Cryptococcus wingfieldii CBS 7118]ODO07139.1 hypothetical protein L198_00718 [Cryptococcus wingfieldii CBS 7118]
MGISPRAALLSLLRSCLCPRCFPRLLLRLPPHPLAQLKNSVAAVNVIDKELVEELGLEARQMLPIAMRMADESIGPQITQKIFMDILGAGQERRSRVTNGKEQ